MIYAFIWCLGWIIAARASQVNDKEELWTDWQHWSFSLFTWPFVIGHLIGER